MDVTSAFIITSLLSTLLPTVAVGYILRTNGKTINFAITGATIIYVVSIVLIFGLTFAAKWLNMPASDLVLLLPLAVGLTFYWMFRGSEMGNE